MDANDKDIMAYNVETEKQATKVYNVKKKNQYGVRFEI